ncbi:hypothetical protein [Acidovorax sp. LjRoot194]|uniref:hypothetical protein n=1 Tax=Acidovorax sp. LjRoot194 TaxID=3342280 RepID=UPI003ECD4522
MTPLLRIVIAFVAAAMAPVIALAFGYLFEQFQMVGTGDSSLWIRTLGFMSLCALVSAAHVVLLGIPAFWLLRWMDVLKWWSVLLAGFVLGCMPMAVFSWPQRDSDMKSSVTIGHVQTVISGVPTTAGWQQYVAVVALFGICGACAAAVFWMVFRAGRHRAVD